MNIIHRNEIRASDDPDTTRAELVADYEQRLMNPYAARRARNDRRRDRPARHATQDHRVPGDARKQARAAPPKEAREYSALGVSKEERGVRLSDEVVAAAIAAVEAYLEGELVEPAPTLRRGISLWRMAVTGQPAVRGFGSNVSWRGRD